MTPHPVGRAALGEGAAPVDTDGPAGRPVPRLFLVRCALHVALCGAIAVAVWHHRLPWILDPQDAQRYLLLGFVFETALLLVLAVPLESTAVTTLLGLDLLGWLSLPGAILATHIAPIWYGGWLTGAIVVKLIPLFWALYLRVPSGLGDRLAALATSSVFLVTSLVMLPYTRFTVAGSAGVTGDEPHYLTVAANLLKGGGFWVGKAYSGHLFASIYGRSIPYSQWRLQVGRTVGGHYGPGHDLGVSLLAVPFYAAGGTKAVMIAMAVVATVTVYEVYLLLRALRVPGQTALVATALAGFSLPFLPFATQISAETPMACCAAIVARRLFARAGSRADILVVATALAVMPWLHVRAWPVVIPLLLGALATWRSRFAWAALIGVPVTSTAGYWSLLYSIYGKFIISPVSLQPGIHVQVSQLGITPIMAGFESLLVDPIAGLLPIAPIWLLGLAGLILVVRHSIAGAATSAAAVLYILFVGASAVLGTGPGTAPPGRFAVVLVPLLAPALALAWGRLGGRWWSEVRWLLVAPSAICVFAVQAVRSYAYPPGPVVRIATYFGVRVPVLTAGVTPWVSLGILALVLGLAVLAIRTRPDPARIGREAET